MVFTVLVNVAMAADAKISNQNYEKLGYLNKARERTFSDACTHSTRRGEVEEAVARTPDVVTRACIATENCTNTLGGGANVANITTGGQC